MKALWHALHGAHSASAAGPTYFVIPITRDPAGPLNPGEPMKVASASTAIELAGSMLATCAGALAVALADGGHLVLARYGETAGDGDELT
jgi:hypothetical protein